MKGLVPISGYMKINITENTPTVLRFTLSGASVNTANALRRLAINSVPTFAIDSVTFYENSTSMFDEYVAHRLGLIPLATPKGYDEKDEAVLSADFEGPGTLYSRDLKSSDKAVKVANEDIPIIKLAEGQRLKFDGKAILRTGIISSKFQPGLVTYSQSEDGKTFDFYIESFGQMHAKDILDRTLAVAHEDMKEIQKAIKK